MLCIISHRFLFSWTYTGVLITGIGSSPLENKSYSTKVYIISILFIFSKPYKIEEIKEKRNMKRIHFPRNDIDDMKYESSSQRYLYLFESVFQSFYLSIICFFLFILYVLGLLIFLGVEMEKDLWYEMWISLISRNTNWHERKSYIWFDIAIYNSPYTS